MSKDLVTPSRNGAPGSINAFTLNGGFTPAYTHFLLTHPATNYSPSTDRLHYYVAALETKAPITTGGQPRQYGLAARSAFRLDSGTITDDLIDFQSSFDAFNDVVQGAVICDGPAAGSPSSTTLGTSILMVTFGSGFPNPASTAATGCYYRDLSTDASTRWTAATGSTYLSAWQIARAGADLYAVCDAGIAGFLGDYRVSKCPAGNNPLLVTSWSNGVEIGGPQWIVTGLTALGDAPVVGKPDGLYYYNGQTRRYENVLKHFELTPHALNGKVTAAVTDGVVYTTFDGGAYIFDGVSTNEITPSKLWKMLGKDVPSARITAIADRGDGIAMFPEVATQTTQNAGLDIRVVTSGLAATDITSGVVDGSLNTGSGTALDSLASGSFIDIWSDIPFEGVIFHVTRSPNSTAATVFDQVLYSSATDTFTAAAGFRDGTRLVGNATANTSGGSLGYAAFPPSASSGMVLPTDINFGSLMQKVSFNYASGTDITLKYGMRIRTSGVMDSDVEIDEVEEIPYRAGLPNEVLLTAATNHTPRFRAGLEQSVYILKRKGTNTFVPHDTFTINNYGATWAAAYHAGRPGQAAGQQNTGTGLVAWGRYATAFISEGPTRNPATDRYAITVAGSATKPHPVWQFLYDWDGNDRTRTKVIEKVMIDTLFVEPTDEWEVFFQYDQRDIVKVAYGKGGPVVFDPPQTPVRVMQAWLVLARGQQTNERAPQFLEPVKVFFEFEDDIQGVQDVARPTPVLT